MRVCVCRGGRAWGMEPSMNYRTWTWHASFARESCLAALTVWRHLTSGLQLNRYEYKLNPTKGVQNIHNSHRSSLSHVFISCSRTKHSNSTIQFFESSHRLLTHSVTPT